MNHLEMKGAMSNTLGELWSLLGNFCGQLFYIRYMGNVSHIFYFWTNKQKHMSCRFLQCAFPLFKPYPSIFSWGEQDIASSVQRNSPKYSKGRKEVTGWTKATWKDTWHFIHSAIRRMTFPLRRMVGVAGVFFLRMSVSQSSFYFDGAQITFYFK